MKILTVLLISLALTGCNPVNFNVTHLLSLTPEDVKDFKPSVRASADNVKIYYRSRTTTALGVEVDLTNPRSLASSTDFSSSKKTVFVIHGWMNSHLTVTSVEISASYLLAEDINLFVVDWSSISFLDYIVAQLSVESIGQIVGDLINSLVANNGLNVADVAIVGHSLGAHIAGVAGKRTGGGMEYIVGLDPAGPFFSIENTANRLDQSDAKFVQVIHTNADMLGIDATIGHADFWPNGGKEQPGCVLDATGLCRHSRSFEYFSESLISGNFIGRLCASYETYVTGSCAGAASSWMGQVQIDKTASGNYYLTTNAIYPYAQG